MHWAARHVGSLTRLGVSGHTQHATIRGCEPRRGSREHVLSGMVRCATGHPSLSAYGVIVKGHTYYRCTYGESYGKVAAQAIARHGATCNVREEALLTRG